MSISDWFSTGLGEDESKQHAIELARKAEQHFAEKYEFDLKDTGLSKYQKSLVGLSYLLCLTQLVEDSGWIDFNSAVEELDNWYDETGAPTAELLFDLEGETGFEGKIAFFSAIESMRGLEGYSEEAVGEAFKKSVDWAVEYWGQSDPTVSNLSKRKSMESQAKALKFTLSEVSQSKPEIGWD